jgi:UDP-N-acetylglucosamine 1-carboxyvinyltransferase
VSIIPDRIEAGTFMIAAGMTHGEINVIGCNPSHLEALINKLRDTGMKIAPIKNGLKVSSGKKINSVDVKTILIRDSPRFAGTDDAYMCIGNGLSVISETVFENRYMHVTNSWRWAPILSFRRQRCCPRRSKLRALKPLIRICGVGISGFGGLLQKAQQRFSRFIISTAV